MKLFIKWLSIGFLILSGCHEGAVEDNSIKTDTSLIIDSRVEKIDADPKTCEINRFYDMIDRALYYGIYADDDGADQLDPEEAHGYYKEGLATVDHTFGIYYSQAFKNALEVGDQEFAKELAIKLAKGGVPKQYFEAHIPKNEAHKWQDFYKNYDTYTTYFKAHYNHSLRKKLIQLFKEDSIHTAHSQVWLGKFGKPGEINPKDYGLDSAEISYEQLVVIYKQLNNRLMEITDKYGLPSESQVGFKMHKNELSLYYYSVLLGNFMSRGTCLPIEEINAAYCNGTLTRGTMKIIMDRFDSFDGTIESEANWFMDFRKKRLEG